MAVTRCCCGSATTGSVGFGQGRVHPFALRPKPIRQSAAGNHAQLVYRVAWGFAAHRCDHLQDEGEPCGRPFKFRPRGRQLPFQLALLGSVPVVPRYEVPLRFRCQRQVNRNGPAFVVLPVLKRK